MSINCKDLPINPNSLYYSLEKGQLQLESCNGNTLELVRKGKHLYVSGTNYKFDMRFDLSHNSTRIMINKDSFFIHNYTYGLCGISNLLPNKLQVLDDVKKLIQY